MIDDSMEGKIRVPVVCTSCGLGLNAWVIPVLKSNRQYGTALAALRISLISLATWTGCGIW